MSNSFPGLFQNSYFKKFLKFESISIRSILILSLAVPLTINLLLINVFFFGNREIKESHDWLVHSREVATYTRNLANDMLMLNKNVRIRFEEETQSEEDVRSSKVLEKFEEKISSLKILVEDNDETMEILSSIQHLTTEFRSLEKNPEQLARGVELLNEIEDLVNNFIASENKLEFEREKTVKRSIDYEFKLLLKALLFIVIYYMFLAYILRKSFFKTFNRITGNLNLAIHGATLDKPIELSSELSILEHKFFDLYRKLEERSSENEGFVYCVSHDLRSPLINIKSFAKELKESTEELEVELLSSGVAINPSIQNLISEGKESLAFILASSEKISQIIEALMGLSRAGRVPINIERVDLDTKIRNLLFSIEYDIRSADAVITLSDLPEIMSDRTAANQIFLNLITNSIKYKDPTRSLIIEIGEDPSKSDENYSAIFVKDNAMGIPANYLERIFLPFEQIKQRKIPGEGLGLSIVKKLLERTGGKIQVESEVNVGTIFTVYFPRVKL